MTQLTIIYRNMRRYLEGFDFKGLFVEVLGWSWPTGRPTVTETVDGTIFRFVPMAELGGMVVYVCEGDLPTTAARRSLEKRLTKYIAEHMVIYTDPQHTVALWTWVKRDEKTSALRTHTYHKGQSADALLQKLGGIAFELEHLDDDGRAHIGEVSRRVRDAFDVETVTKKFYDLFKKEHDAFYDFLVGIEAETDRAWYTSVMLNRLMFLYFIQKKQLLNGDTDYLRTHLAKCEKAGENYYDAFLKVLFFEGIAKDPQTRIPQAARLGKNIPYLNGGLFLEHETEQRWPGIALPNAAFTRLYAFFDKYTWHLDDRPLRQGNEINPDVLGYIFEKYINQKQMGAYYTKEDITNYICRSTILPFLLGKVGADVRAVVGDNLEPYVFEAVKTEAYLPTETEREYAARQRRYAAIRDDYGAGKIATVDDLITYNLDIEAFAADWLRRADAEQTRAFYQALTRLTVLDPTCGSGAFLFAAIQILEPLYDVALERLARFQDTLKHGDFVSELQVIEGRINRRYFILKRIILNNLYGVDIMPEAVEICKLRLFLKLVAQVEAGAAVEPLPDIDFNIRAGNTLVGFATRDEIDPSHVIRMYDAKALLAQVEVMEGTLRDFRRMQLAKETTAAQMGTLKANIQAVLATIRAQLDEALMLEYGHKDLGAFRASHQPFHWYVEFYHVLSDGGFDVIVGNPPYVEYSKVRKDYTIRGYETLESGNIFAVVFERSKYLSISKGFISMILPISASCTDRTISFQEFLMRFNKRWCVSFDIFPAKVFDGAAQRVTIVTSINSEMTNQKLYASNYQRWYQTERVNLISKINYIEGSGFDVPSWTPRISTKIELSILQKMPKRKLNSLISDKGMVIFVHRIVNNYVKALDFAPFFRRETGEIGTSDDFKKLYTSDKYKHIIIALLNSNLFFWYWRCHGDGFHCGYKDIGKFPFSIDELTDETNSQLLHLVRLLMEDVNRNSQIRTRNQVKTGKVELQTFFIGLSKPIIDEIDRVLARHYGFTDEELDFIINYDIKYRMGRDAESEAGEGEGDE